MNFLFLFMDGVGLGGNDPDANPLARAGMPNLEGLLDGKKLLDSTAPMESKRATLLALDATLGVPKLPQSATGQAALLTGKNVPAIIGEHYGPKPNGAVAEVIRQGTLFSELVKRGYSAALLNAYPARYFEGIESGHRIYSSIPLAVVEAGIGLKTAEDLFAGEALSVDFTGQAWRERLGYNDTPVMSHKEAGKRLAQLSRQYDLAFFEFWPSDFPGHRQDMEEAVDLLERFDRVLGGLVGAWEDEEGLILITSDHGNLEDLSTRRHTENKVPGLVIGGEELRARFTKELRDLTDVAPGILELYA